MDDSTRKEFSKNVGQMQGLVREKVHETVQADTPPSNKPVWCAEREMIQLGGAFYSPEQYASYFCNPPQKERLARELAAQGYFKPVIQEESVKIAQNRVWGVRVKDMAFGAGVLVGFIFLVKYVGVPAMRFAYDVSKDVTASKHRQN